MEKRLRELRPIDGTAATSQLNSTVLRRRPALPVAFESFLGAQTGQIVPNWATVIPENQICFADSRPWKVSRTSLFSS